jgi:hypothetical protein
VKQTLCGAALRTDRSGRRGVSPNTMRKHSTAHQRTWSRRTQVRRLARLGRRGAYSMERCEKRAIRCKGRMLAFAARE